MHSRTVNNILLAGCGWSWWRWGCPDADAMPRRDHGVDPTQCARRDVPPSSRATCPPRPGLSRSSDVHHQNASRATCAATTELASVGRCFLAGRGNTAVRGQVSVVAMRPRAPHCLVFSQNATMWRVVSRAMPRGATWLCSLAIGRS